MPGWRAQKNHNVGCGLPLFARFLRLCQYSAPARGKVQMFLQQHHAAGIQWDFNFHARNHYGK